MSSKTHKLGFSFLLCIDSLTLLFNDFFIFILLEEHLFLFSFLWKKNKEEYPLRVLIIYVEYLNEWLNTILHLIIAQAPK